MILQIHSHLIKQTINKMSKQRHIAKSLLTPSLIPSISANSPPNILKLLKFIKLHNDSLIVTLADSTYSIIGVLTPISISQYERQYKRRVTEGTVNNLIRIRGHYEYWTREKVFGISGFRFYRSVPVLKIDEIDIIDISDESVEGLIEFVYDYMPKTEFVIPEARLQS